jgi:hypothetical protein
MRQGNDRSATNLLERINVDTCPTEGASEKAIEVEMAVLRAHRSKTTEEIFEETHNDLNKPE